MVDVRGRIGYNYFKAISINGYLGGAVRLTFITIFTILQFVMIIVLFIMVLYPLWLAIKALKLYIRKNSK